MPNAAKLSGQTPVQLRYTGLVPSGVTLRGSWGYDTQSAGAGDYRAYVSYGADFGAALTAEYAGTGTTTHCTGSVNTPTAQGGFVCFYIFPSPGGVSSLNAINGSALNTRWGSAMQLNVNAAAGADVFANGTWAATAP